MLCPHEITKRLPELKGLFPLLIPPDWPPGEIWTPGISIDPDVVFPEGWTPDDPLPAGVTISPETVFPPGWAAGDPVPKGVTISSSAVFPAGWAAGDPMPAGVTIGRRQRPAVLGAGAIPPYYIQVWEPGPAHRPADTPVEVLAPWFHDPFDVLDPGVWTDTSNPPATAEVLNGELILTSPPTYELSQVRHSFTENYPENFYIEFKSRIEGNYYYFGPSGYSGVYRWGIAFYPQDPWIDLRYNGGWYGGFVAPFANIDITWKLTIVGGEMNLYRDDVLLYGPLTPESNATLPQRVWLETSDAITRVDYVTIDAP